MYSKTKFYYFISTRLAQQAVVSALNRVQDMSKTRLDTHLHRAKAVGYGLSDILTMTPDDGALTTDTPQCKPACLCVDISGAGVNSACSLHSSSLYSFQM